MTRIKQINPPAPLSDAARHQITGLALRQRGAQSLVMTAMTHIGGQVESGLRSLPQTAQDRLNAAAANALSRSYELAARSQSTGLKGTRAHKIAATVTGAVGGAGGLVTSLIEMPVAITTIFRAVQQVAEEYGFDPQDAAIRVECLQVFGAGAPGEGDDGVDTAFLGARMALNGASLHSLIARIAPRVAGLLGQKLASQAVPILGAVAGAGTNYAFVDYYTQIAQVHFGLKALGTRFGDDQVLEAFHAELARLDRPKLQA